MLLLHVSPEFLFFGIPVGFMFGFMFGIVVGSKKSYRH